MEIVFLGTGSSTGTPVIGCDCATCRSADPRNKRTRASVAVSLPQGPTLLIDTGPDLRLQALREGLLRVDGVLYTHTHADHLNGIDDLRNFCYLQRAPIPIFGNETTVRDIEARFRYAFAAPGQHWDKPVLTAHAVCAPFHAAGLEVTPLPVLHGRLPILGYRIGDIAYITDVSEIPEATLPLLRNLDVLMLDCLHDLPHPTHMHLARSLEYAQAIAARRTYFIHMTHRMEFVAASRQLPDGVELAYDGLRVSVPQG
ncbi:MAG: MBL fold metallo-hydrolase [Betaproteobacteria bacterium]|nr:MBL fold metallo-hydrolase [Betaproteobacteria bacterium]